MTLSHDSPFPPSFQKPRTSRTAFESNQSTSALNISTVDGALMAAANAQCIELLPYEVRSGLGGLDRYSSLDSNDTFLSCNTHPYPSQGSLAGLEELAAKGSMAANGSMPAVNVNIDGNKSGVYVNPFDPKDLPSKGKGIGLNNVRQRLSLIYGNEAEMRIEKSKNTFTCRLFLPV